jgi:NADP-dependent 3-hydroxy acid dehydrogenase YdfG
MAAGEVGKLQLLREMVETPEVVVITGASAGVGRAAAREFAKRGASIGLLARGKAALEAAKREVEELGGRALVLPLDVSKYHEVQAAALEVEQKLGPIDISIGSKAGCRGNRNLCRQSSNPRSRRARSCGRLITAAARSW